MKSHTTGRAVVSQLPGQEPELHLLVVIDCPACGMIEIAIPGHHLRPLRDLCLEFIDRFPTLTGTESGMTVVRREQFVIQDPSDPEVQ